MMAITADEERMTNMKKMLLIINPRSGRCKGMKKLGEIVRIAQSRDYLPTVLITGKAGDARDFARDLGGTADLVACVGGDGTFSEVVAGMIDGGHTTPLGYIPAGSTNDYAASLGLAKKMETAAQDMFDGVEKTFDAGRQNGQSFTYVTAFGMPAKASYGAPQKLKNLLGHFAYILEGIRDLHTLKAEHARITVDDEVLEGDYLMGTISNTTSIGGILQFNPDDVLLNDGYLELMLVAKPSSLGELSALVGAITKKRYTDCACITFRKSKHIRIDADDPMPWTIDGEYMPDGREAEVEAVPAAIRVMVPAVSRRKKGKKD